MSDDPGVHRFGCHLRRVPLRNRVIPSTVPGGFTWAIGPHILEETERNLAGKAPAALTAFRTLTTLLELEIVARPSRAEVGKAATYIHIKDAPVVAAAIRAKADYLVTWDRKHFIDNPRVAEQSGLTIVTPDELLALVEGRSRGRP